MKTKDIGVYSRMNGFYLMDLNLAPKELGVLLTNNTLKMLDATSSALRLLPVIDQNTRQCRPMC